MRMKLLVSQSWMPTIITRKHSLASTLTRWRSFSAVNSPYRWWFDKNKKKPLYFSIVFFQSHKLDANKVWHSLFKWTIYSWEWMCKKRVSWTKAGLIRRLNTSLLGWEEACDAPSPETGGLWVVKFDGEWWPWVKTNGDFRLWSIPLLCGFVLNCGRVDEAQLTGY